MSSLASEEANWREAVGGNNQWKPLTPPRSTTERANISANNSNEDASGRQLRALLHPSEPNTYPHQYSHVSDAYSNTTAVDHGTGHDSAHSRRFESHEASMSTANVLRRGHQSEMVQSCESSEDYPLDYHPVAPADYPLDTCASSPRSLSMKTVDIHHRTSVDSPGDQVSMTVIDIHSSPRDSAHSPLHSQLSLMQTTPLVSPLNGRSLDKHIHLRSPLKENNAWGDEDGDVLLTREECADNLVLVDLRYQSSESLEHAGNTLVDLESSRSCYSLRECESLKASDPPAAISSLPLSDGWSSTSPDFARRTRTTEALQRFDNNTFERKAGSVIEPRPTPGQLRNTASLFVGMPPADATYDNRNSAKRQSWQNESPQSRGFAKPLVSSPPNSYHLTTPTLVAPPLNIHKNTSSPTSPGELTPLHFTPLHTMTIDNTGRTTTVSSASPYHNTSAGSSKPIGGAPSWMVPRYLTPTSSSSPSVSSPNALISPHVSIVARPTHASDAAYHDNDVRQLTKAAAAAQHFAQVAFFRPAGQSNVVHSSAVTNQKLNTATQQFAADTMLRASVRNMRDESPYTKTPAAVKLVDGQCFTTAETPTKSVRRGAQVAEVDTELSQQQQQDLGESAHTKQFASTEKSHDSAKSNDTRPLSSSITQGRTTQTMTAVASNAADCGVVEETITLTAPPSTKSRATTSAALPRGFVHGKRSPMRTPPVLGASGIRLAKEKLDRILMSTNTRLSRSSPQSHARPLGHSASEQPVFHPASLRNPKGEMRGPRDDIDPKRQQRQQSIVPVHGSEVRPRRHSTNDALLSRASPPLRKTMSANHVASTVRSPGSYEDARHSAPRSSRLHDGQIPRIARTSPRRSVVQRVGLSQRAPGFRSALERRPVETWDVDDVRIWCFDTLELPLLAEMFFHRGIDGPQLLDMTEERLENEFGVGRETKERLECSLGSRLTLSRVIGHIDIILRNRESNSTGEELTSSRINLGIARRGVNEEVYGRETVRRVADFAWDPSPRNRANRMSLTSARSPERNSAAALYADPASEPFARSLTGTSPRFGTFNRAVRNTKDAFLAHVERTPGVCHYRNAAPPPPKIAGGTIPKSERWARDLKLSPRICPGPWTYNPRHHMRSNFEKTTCETNEHAGEQEPASRKCVK
eukprot:GEMP01001081.1.p1 GENE.GEMP01001081.1~~GEMP01001081.1.p1  ORF type:complete len:1152 (+),score=217.99 GEMP01001081.1:1442-4897(+)